MILAAWFLLICFSDATTIRSSRRGSSESFRSLKSVVQPNYTLYHHKNQLLEKVRNIANANKDKGFKLETFNAENGTYRSELIVITIELNSSSPSPSPSTTNTSQLPATNNHPGSHHSHPYRGKLRVLLDFGQHAREYITSELALSLLNVLSDLNGPAMRQAMTRALGGSNSNSNSKGDNKPPSEERIASAISAIRDRVVFKIIPMENELGRDLVEGGKLCERKNGRGVDPNRNYPVDWGKKEKDYNPQEEYPGTAPFSEPEAQLIKGITESFRPHVWLNVHSGMEALFVPWDHLPEVPQGAQEALQVIKTIHAELFAPQHKECVVGSGGKEVGYLAHGTATDYMFHVMKVPLPFTFEIFGDLKANYDDCFKMFNPIDEAQMKETLSVWLAAILRLMDLAPRHSLVATELMIESGATTGWGHGEIIEVRKPLTERYGWLIKIGAAVALMALLAFMALKSTRPVASPLPVSSPAAFISKSGFERV